MTNLSSIELDREARYLDSLVDYTGDPKKPCFECEQPGMTYQVVEECIHVVNVDLCADCAEREVVDCEHDGAFYDHWAWKDECLPFTKNDTKPKEIEWLCRAEYERRLDAKYQFGRMLEETFAYLKMRYNKPK